MAAISSKNLVFGIRLIMPLEGWPEGRIRIRLRNTGFASGYVKTPDGIREFAIEERDGRWWPSYERGANHRIDNEM